MSIILKMNIISSRKCKANYGDNQVDLLIYVKETDAFVLLLLMSNYPSNLAGLSFDLTTTPSILSQLSLFIRNVDSRVDFVDFEREIKDQYPQYKKRYLIEKQVR
jgi:hypothetical protein